MMTETSKSALLRGARGQFAGFATVGAINTVLTFLLYQVLYLWAPYWLAYTLSFLVGIVFSLLMNARLVFGQPITAVSTSYFVSFYLLSYAAGLAIVAGLIEGLHVPARLAPIGAIAVLVFINFVGTRFALSHR